MQVEGELDCLLADVVPHEVTHVVLADHFKKPLPRWADEGIALASESEEERARHAGLFAEAANAGRLIQVKALLAAREYPTDVGGFFAESYWLAKVLVDRKARATLLAFVHDGMKDGWEAAARAHYGATLDELERAMLDRAKAERKAAGPAIAHYGAMAVPTFARATADVSGQVTVFQRTTTYYEPVTSYQTRIERVEGTQVTRSGVVPVTTYRQRTGPLDAKSYPRGTLRAVTPQGKPIERAALIEALQGKTVAVVVVTNTDTIDKAYADLLKPDTLILIVPPERSGRAAPAGGPAAGKAAPPASGVA